MFFGIKIDNFYQPVHKPLVSYTLVFDVLDISLSHKNKKSIRRKPFLFLRP